MGKHWSEMTDEELRAEFEQALAEEAAMFGKDPALLIKRGWAALKAPKESRLQERLDAAKNITG